MALWLSGSSAKRVFCQGQAFDPEVGACGDFDLVVATVLFENGVVAVVDNGRKSSQAYDQRLEVGLLHHCFFFTILVWSWINLKKKNH